MCYHDVAFITYKQENTAVDWCYLWSSVTHIYIHVYTFLILTTKNYHIANTNYTKNYFKKCSMVDCVGFAALACCDIWHICSGIYMPRNIPEATQWVEELKSWPDLSCSITIDHQWQWDSGPIAWRRFIDQCWLIGRAESLSAMCKNTQNKQVCRWKLSKIICGIQTE